MWFRLLLILLLMSRVILWKVDHFVAKISGDENVAKEISKTFGVHYLGEVHHVLPQIGRLRVLRNKSLSILSSSEELNRPCSRVTECATWDINFNDPFFPYQWYLDAGVSYDVSGTWISSDPMPDLRHYIQNSHGTQCAAIISAAGNNSYCGVGVAFKAKVGGVRLLKGEKSHVIDAQEALALRVAITKRVDIIVSSWGPPDNGKSIGEPEELAKQAIIEGIEKGRNGKGAIFLWAVGNGGLSDNCNLDGYASSIYTIAISSLTKSGYPCVYDEPCSATLASCYVGGKEPNDRNHLHTDNMVVPQLDGGCKNSFQGTSAATPLAAGIVALMLQANGNLTWRDVQHIIVRSARKPSNHYGWLQNGAGLSYHIFSGFGAIDAAKAAELSSTWDSVPPQRNVTALIPGLPRYLLPTSRSLLKVLVPPREDFKTFILEHTILIVSLASTTRGKIELSLTSPSGTVSHLLTERPLDDAQSGFKDWRFMSTHFWLEDPTGVWAVVVNNLTEDFGEIKDARILFYGFCVEQGNKKSYMSF
ncbi:hypothetical protein J437_LFUL005706 [Ladona fulva]|uniref:P/Homo B domain-containing protein n=1 Tax=Ladona fulva TaxID=123851 RepID=A0A8K0P111_LADFU|nr:hypothetical protein J437_LFUL005706 [Ladona fulva]